MSKMKRALFFKDKYILDDNTVWHVEDVRWDEFLLKGSRSAMRLKKLYFILRDAHTGEEMWHPYNDKQRKKYYIVVACRSRMGLGNGVAD